MESVWEPSEEDTLALSCQHSVLSLRNTKKSIWSICDSYSVSSTRVLVLPDEKSMTISRSAKGTKVSSILSAQEDRSKASARPVIMSIIFLNYSIWVIFNAFGSSPPSDGQKSSAWLPLMRRYSECPNPWISDVIPSLRDLPTFDASRGLISIL